VIARPRRRAQPERGLQCAVVEHLAWRAPADIWRSHFPAGGRRNVIDGVVLKRMGVRAERVGTKL
jgi:hypothetical protein